MKPVFILGLAAALAPSLGFGMPRALVPAREEPRPLSPADQERIAAAQAKRERKAARLAALARAS